MATTQIDSTTPTDERPTEYTETTTDSPPTTSWTARCGAPMTFDPTSRTVMGQFETTAEERHQH